MVLAVAVLTAGIVSAAIGPREMKYLGDKGNSAEVHEGATQ